MRESYLMLLTWRHWIFNSILRCVHKYLSFFIKQKLWNTEKKAQKLVLFHLSLIHLSQRATYIWLVHIKHTNFDHFCCSSCKIFLCLIQFLWSNVSDTFECVETKTSFHCCMCAVKAILQFFKVVSLRFIRVCRVNVNCAFLKSSPCFKRVFFCKIISLKIYNWFQLRKMCIMFLTINGKLQNNG